MEPITRPKTASRHAASRVSGQMRQARIAAADRFEVVDGPVPGLRGPGEILVRTVACGICSGDLMPWYLQKKVGSRRPAATWP